MNEIRQNARQVPNEASDPVLEIQPLGFPWQTPDPFLFCVYHQDAYPKGNDDLGPAASLAGRDIGEDFEGKDGWRMYHGTRVPGFPQHPHRGFETVTVVRRGHVDHSDSAGATARYGEGDVQWLTAGKGILHSEMFPLLRRDEPNPLELFQIWLNLPRADKLVEPYFSMLWADKVPRVSLVDNNGRAVEAVIVAGQFGEVVPPAPPPSSWAARPDADVAIWTIRLAANAVIELPPSMPGSNRMLYVFRGAGLRIGPSAISVGRSVRVRAGVATPLENGPEESELLLLQGQPIGEPVVNYGPFVMTTRDEILETIAEYRRTGFGGWSWQGDDPVHPREQGRFARRPDGRIERP